MKFMDIFKDKYSSWKELEAVIESLPTTKLRGDAFEDFCFLYFSVKKTHFQIAELYMIKDVPTALLEKYHLESRDCGVDGLIIRSDGTSIAYQCKFRAGRVAPSYDELSKFWVEGKYCDYRCTIANCDHLTELAKKQENAFNILVQDFDALDEEFFIDLYNYANSKDVVKKKHRARKYQETIIREVTKGLEVENRGKMIAACGTGKTLTALWITEQISCDTVLFLAPSITLVKQTLESWTDQASKSFAYICICSDNTVTDSIDDNVDISISDLGVPVTTKPEEIRTFLERECGCRKYIFSTYQSADKIANAIEGMGLVLDLIICDEAHRTAGLGGCFNLALDDGIIPAKKRLFMTATERLVTPILARHAEEDGQVVFSMDDESKYGPLLSRYNFGDAIKDGTISDYKIVIAGVKETDIYNYIVENTLLKFDDLDRTQKYEVAQSLYAKILLAKSMKEFSLKKVVTFHSSIERAKDFVASNGVSTDLRSFIDTSSSDVSTLYVSHVNGKQSAGERSRIMQDFKSSEVGIVSNSKCLTEGVDVPMIDSVFFVDQKKSLVDIVQACGRALRTVQGVDKTAYFIVPILIPEEGDPTNVFNQEEFDNVYNIIQALRDQDARLADWITLLNKTHVKGEKRPRSKEDDGPVIVDVEGINLEQFKDKLYTKIATANQIVNFGPKPEFEYTRWSRTAGQARVFKTFGDYNVDSARASIDATLSLYKNAGKSRVETSDIKIDHNNIANTIRLGFIEKIGRLYSLTPLGRDYMQKKVAYDQVVQRQLLRYSTALENGAKALFPYRTFFEILLRLKGEKSINLFEFVFCIYPITESSEEAIKIAVEDIEYARTNYPNWVDISLSNREKLLEELNEYYRTTISEVDLWASRSTTIKNQFGYFANHLSCFKDFIKIEGRGNSKRIILQPGCEKKLMSMLDETRHIETHSKEQLLAKYTEAFLLLTLFVL